MSVKIFLSTVSDEFESYREQLRADLTRPNVDVKDQEYFKALGGETLEMLDDYIASCDAVVHLVGDMAGAAPSERGVRAILEKYRDDMDHYRNLTTCLTCGLKPQCTPDKVKRQKRWEHEAVLDRMQARLDRMPEAMPIRRQTVEHPFGTLKAWMGSTHFLTKTLEKVKTEMSLHVLAYNMKRIINIFGVRPLMQAIAG